MQDLRFHLTPHSSSWRPQQGPHRARQHLQWPHPTQILIILSLPGQTGLSGAQLCPATLHPALPGLERTGLEKIHLLHPTEQHKAEVQPLQLDHDGFTAAPRTTHTPDVLPYSITSRSTELPTARASSSALSCILCPLQGHQKGWTGGLRGGVTPGRAPAACELGLPLPPRLSARWDAGGSKFSQSLSKQLCFIRKAAQIYSFFPGHIWTIPR